RRLSLPTLRAQAHFRHPIFGSGAFFFGRFQFPDGCMWPSCNGRLQNLRCKLPTRSLPSLVTLLVNESRADEREKPARGDGGARPGGLGSPFFLASTSTGRLAAEGKSAKKLAELAKPLSKKRQRHASAMRFPFSVRRISKGMFCELGGEFVDSNHRHLRELLSEFGLKRQKLPDKGQVLYFFKGAFRTDKDILDPKTH